MVKEVNNENRAYFAGLLDGEGCIRIHKSKSGKSICYCLKVQFNVTYKNILLEMQKLFGGNIYEKDMSKGINCKSSQVRILNERASPENWKQGYLYEISGRDALYFLKLTEPFCREKKEQAALGIRYEEGKRPFAGSYGRSDSETKRCEFFYKELQRLKHEKQEDILESCIENDFKDEQQNLFSFVEEI